jgi:zinc D-Ala-D-Ala carboxypeptidase
MRRVRRVVLLTTIFLAACHSQAALPSTPTVTLAALPTFTPTATAIPTPTPTPTPTLTPSPTLFPLPISDMPTVACNKRHPAADDLLLIVTASYGLDPDYVPPDLISLGDYVSWKVAPSDYLLRLEAATALGQMVKAMQADGLAPTVLSAYRGYYDQVVTYQKWLEQNPAYVNQISAQPGHSEHQLGTVIDFGSPELPGLVGDPTVQFHPLFAQTSEGEWLTAHAHEYGFTLTNPPGAQPFTGLTYEPWHYRYVGVGLATYLNESGYFLTEYLFMFLKTLPCIPDLGGR